MCEYYLDLMLLLFFSAICFGSQGHDFKSMVGT